MNRLSVNPAPGGSRIERGQVLTAAALCSRHDPAGETVNAFREAVEAGDHAAIPALLAADATFLSPMAFSPYEGRELVAAILRGAARVFTDFRYEREISSADGRDVALVFRARIGDREVHGCDFLRLGEDGLIAELCVMVRPQSASHALGAAMAEQFEIIGRERRLNPGVEGYS